MTKKKQKICIQRADRLGDVVLSLPVIESIKKKFPESEIHVLTSSIGATFLKDFPNVDRCIVMNTEWGWFSNEYRSLYKKLKNENYDLYLSLWNHPKCAVMGWLSKAKVRIGDSTDKILAFFYTTTVRQNWEDLTRHQSEFNQDLLEPLSISTRFCRSKISINKNSKEKIKKTLKKWINPQKKTLLIFTATGGSNFPIPMSAITSFIIKMQTQSDIDIILSGPENSLKEGEKEALNFPNVVNMIGKTTLSELTALIDLCDYYMGPDTGPTHIASFLNKPMIFFSPLNENPPTRWGPLSGNSQIIRKEYMTKTVDKMNENQGYFWYMTGDLLMHYFGELLLKESLKEASSYAQIKKQHICTSFRIICPVDSVDNLFHTKKIAQKLEEKGILVFTYLSERGVFKYFKQTIQKLKQHNAYIVHGIIPLWLRVSIKLFQVIILHKRRPVFIQVPLFLPSSEDDLLGLYVSQFHDA
jgi:ADP-heptose:LPS heptosyltransferase